MRGFSAWLALPLATIPLTFSACGSPRQQDKPLSSPSGRSIQVRVAAAGASRPFELRLSGGFGYARCDAVSSPSELIARTRCAGSPQPHTQAAEVLSTAGEEIRRLSTLSRPLRLHTEAFFALLRFERQSALDLAVEKLEQGTEQAPTDALILNDLGVAFFLRAQQRQQPLDLVQALTALDRAVDADGSLLEARFNRARTLQMLSLETDAREAWRDYLEREVDPAWKAEAHRNLGTLDALDEMARQELTELSGPGAEGARRAVHRRPQMARDHAERDLLPLWANALSSDRLATARQALDSARVIGAFLAQETGEKLLLEEVGAIDAALTSGDRRQLKSLIDGHRALGAGYTLYRQARTADALSQLARSQELLGSAGSPAALWASFFRACAIYQAEHYTASLRVLQALEKKSSGKGYLSLEAHIAWMQGQNRMVSGHPLDSLHLYRQAAAQFRAARETENAATLASLVGQSLDYLGRHREAWAELYAALRAASEMADPKRLFLVYVNAADCVLWQGQPRTATYFQNEVVRQAVLSKNPQLQADSLFWRGLMRELARGPGRGRDDFAEAHRAAALLSDEAARQRVGADIAMVEGSLQAAAHPEQAISQLTPAIAFYERVNLRVQAASMAYQARARAFREIRDDRREEADLLSGIEIAEERMRSGQPSEPRWALIERPGGLFDEMIALQVRTRRDKAAGYAFAERSLNRALPSFDPALAAPLNAAGVQRALPPATTLVQYAVLEDRLLIWVLGSRRMDLFEVPTSRRALAGAVERWQRSDWQEPAAHPGLYDLLIRPWIDSVPAQDLLVIVPSRALEGVSFGALQDRLTGHYLIESHPIAVAPSATLLIAALRSLLSRPRGDGVALVVGNPAFDRNEFPGLPSLAAADAEATFVSRLFPGSRLLTGAAADRDSFISLLPKADLIHFAGHAVANDASPELSMLLLAPSRTGQGMVLARDLYRLDLRHARLVVLSVCGGSANAGAEGMTDLARAFLVAGTPTVVASLHPVEDRGTASLFAAFYHHLVLGEEPSQALRQAQLSMLQGKDPVLRRPASWAAFQVVGASRPNPQKGR